MNTNRNLKLPADCTRMTGEEMIRTHGGAAAETAVKAVIAIGGAAALLVVGSAAARGILSIFGGEGGLSSVIEDSVNRGRNLIDGALDAGQSFLDALMGR